MWTAYWSVPWQFGYQSRCDCAGRYGQWNGKVLPAATQIRYWLKLNVIVTVNKCDFKCTTKKTLLNQAHPRRIQSTHWARPKYPTRCWFRQSQAVSDSTSRDRDRASKSDRAWLKQLNQGRAPGRGTVDSLASLGQLPRVDGRELRKAVKKRRESLYKGF